MTFPCLSATRRETEMAVSAWARRFGVCLPIALLSVGALVTPAMARATVGTYSFTEPETTFTEPSGCDGLIGTVTHTGTDSGRYVDTGHSFHVTGTNVQYWRVDFSDGTYIINHSPSHYTFNFNEHVSVNTETQQVRGTIYDAGGQVIGHTTMYAVRHMTWSDLDGDGQPDPDEFRSEFDHFRFRDTCP
jgi:hypothetical protein